MKLCFGLFFFYFLFLKFNEIQSTDEVDEIDHFDDIPVIEGDGGVVTTAVEDDVLILTRENFDLQVTSKDIILVEFYAPWCGHCQSLAPEYAKAAQMLKAEDPPIPLAKVDATLETELASRYEVTGYPTLIVFKKGQHIPYEGPRSAMGIVEYMKERADPNWKPPPTAVLTLTSENFTKVIEKADIILVEFYAPWCGHCKQLAPEYERAAKVLKGASIPLAKVDGTIEKDLANQYEARGWPTLMVFRRGKKFAYEGPRNEAGIISYMKEQAKPPSQLIKSAVEIQKHQKDTPLVVGFFPGECPLYESFQESGNTLRGKFTFLHTFSEEILRQYRIQKPSVVLFQADLYLTDFEPKKFVLDDPEASALQVTDFVLQHSLPLVGERSRKSTWKYENKFPLVVVYYDVDFSFDHRTETQRVRREVAKVAKDYRGKITFAVSHEEDYTDELAQLGLADSGEDVNAGFFRSASVRYSMEPVEEFSAKELRAFVQKVMDGKIPRHIQSQPVPKKNDKSPVLTVVGSTFDELVLQNPKDVLIEFYAPWCGHCKRLEPVYKKLGKQFAGDGRVVVAKIDATANDVPSEFAVEGFPTLYYVTAGDKKITKYEGDRSFEDLKKFVDQQLSPEEKLKDEL